MRNSYKIYDYSIIVIVTLLTCWFFWEAIVKRYIDNYIKKEYGIAIIETKNNSDLTLEILKQNDSIGDKKAE